MDDKEQKTLFPNETITGDEKQTRSNEDKAEAATYKKPFLVIKMVDSVDIITKITEKYEIIAGIREGEKKKGKKIKKEGSEDKADYDL